PEISVPPLSERAVSAEVSPGREGVAEIPNEVLPIHLGERPWQDHRVRYADGKSEKRLARRCLARMIEGSRGARHELRLDPDGYAHLLQLRQREAFVEIRPVARFFLGSRSLLKNGGDLVIAVAALACHGGCG